MTLANPPLPRVDSRQSLACTPPPPTMIVMALPEPSCSPTPAAGALPTTWARLRTSLLRHVVVVGGICVSIALVLSIIDGRGFWTKLVYSLSIGTVCTLIVDSTRLAWAWAVDISRQRRGLPLAGRSTGWQSAIPGSVLALLFGPALGLTLADWLTGGKSVSLLQWDSPATRLTMLFSVLATVVSVAVIGGQEMLASARAQAEAARRQAAENQLRLLQSQLEPHMLFNTLANLRVLIGLEPARAQAMLDHLIAFLRATLNASRTAAHPLATEFERLADYLALMGVRMGPRLQVDLQLPEALRALPVPPLLLQPLVENAIKHGLEPHVEGGLIQVSAWAEGATLVLSVRDTGAGLSSAAAPGGTQFGLSQIRERLATLHGEQASLTLAAADDSRGGTLATVRMPLPGSVPFSRLSTPASASLPLQPLSAATALPTAAGPAPALASTAPQTGPQTASKLTP